MRIVRLESDIDLAQYNNYNKLFVFNPESGILDGYQCEEFLLTENSTINDILNAFNVSLPKDELKLYVNRKVSGSYSYPFKIFVDITDRCNLNCKHCLTKDLNQGYELSLASIKDIASECAEGGVFFVKLGGGEPLLHPNIFEIIKTFRDNNVYVSLSINGSFVDEKTATFLKDYNVRVSVSLEGPKDLDDELRGPGHFEKAIKTLQLLKRTGCNVLLRTTLTRALLNVEKIVEMIDIAQKNDVLLKISYCRPAGNAIDNKLLIRFEDYQEYYEVLKVINAPKYSKVVIMDEGMQFVQQDALSNILYNNRICGSANRSMHINSRGEISPCIFLGKDFIEKSSSYKYGDLIKFWSEDYGSKFKKIRDINEPSLCVSCSRKCKYECLATRYNSTGTYECSDPNCITEVLKKCQIQK